MKNKQIRLWMVLVAGLLTCMATAASELVRLDEMGKLVYQAYTDRGDKLLDFSYCGYRRSEEPIPDVPAVITVAPPSGEHQPDGTRAYPKGPDSQALIQQAIDEVGTRPAGRDGFRGAVLLKRGTYFVYGSLKASASGVVLRGEGDGEDGTVLIFKKGGGVGITLGHAGDPCVPTELETAIADDYVPAGAMSIRVARVAGLRAGDAVRVWKTPNQKWIDDLGMNTFAGSMKGKKPWTPKEYRVYHPRKIQRIDGNTLFLDVPLPQSIASEHGGGYVNKVDTGKVVERCGLEHMRLISDFDTAVKTRRNTTQAELDGKQDYYSDEKTNLMDVIHLGVTDGWVRDCTILHARRCAVGLRRSAIFCTVRNCKSLQPVSVITGGRRYPFNIDGAMCLVQDCFSEFGRHDFVVGARNTGPNVFLDCVGENSYSTSEPHHRWATGTLFDNIRLTGNGALAAMNRGGSGSGHGWAGGNMVFWNGNARQVVVFDPPTSENNFAIGYTGEKRDSYSTGLLDWANARAGLKGASDAGVYKGYALMGNGHIESPDRPVEPRSLFLQQLIERIGKGQP